ncbi:MAG TPA: hypothetical protein VE988_24935 [Gemmataceae bacterium]|nr:hypothetical protein [Gemmataceae bacterium]
MTLILDLSPELERRLAREAEGQGTTIADYALRLLEQQLVPTDAEFKNAATHILQKNADLYRRLA